MVAIAFNATQCLRIPRLHHSITIHKVFSIMRAFFVYFPISPSYYSSFLLSVPIITLDQELQENNVLFYLTQTRLHSVYRFFILYLAVPLSYVKVTHVERETNTEGVIKAMMKWAQYTGKSKELWFMRNGFQKRKSSKVYTKKALSHWTNETVILKLDLNSLIT